MIRSAILAIVVFLPVLNWGATNLPCGVSVGLNYNASSSLGSNLVWTVHLANLTNVTRTCKLTLDADALTYNGEHIGDVITQFSTNTLTSNSASNVELVITASAYSNWTGATRTFELSAYMEIEGQPDKWIDIGRIVMQSSTNIIYISPTSPIQTGHSMTGTVSCLNPLPITIHNVKVTMTADPGLSANAILIESEWNIGSVASNSLINVSTNYTAVQLGKHNISAFITADELQGIEGSVQVEVVAP